MCTLSDNAKKLLTALRAKPLHENNALKAIFPEPKFIVNDPNLSNDEIAKIQRDYWQWDVNFNGIGRERPVLGIQEYFEPTGNYLNSLYSAYSELKKAGLVKSSNNGYNSYTFFAK